MAIAEWIGSATFNVGPGKVVLLPMIWALLMGGTLGLLKNRLPAALRIETAMQFDAATILQPALLLFVAKLGLLVGGSIPKIIAAGWALMFQEFGHFVGTILFGLPIALLLGIKREAIGATFSVGRGQPGDHRREIRHGFPRGARRARRIPDRYRVRRRFHRGAGGLHHEPGNLRSDQRWRWGPGWGRGA